MTNLKSLITVGALLGLVATSSFAENKDKKAAVVAAPVAAAPAPLAINSDVEKMGYFLGQEFTREFDGKWDANSRKAIEQGIADSQDSTKKAYLLGLQIGVNLKAINERLKPMNESMNTAIVLQGIQDKIDNKTPLVSEDTARAAQQRLGQKAMELDKAKKMAEQAAQIKVGEDYLAKNKQNPAVKVTASGLQYEVITEGKGIRPASNDTVLVHYKGTLIDGKVFDESYTRGQPVSFALDQVIPGWTEGIQFMSEGSKYKYTIPSNLAYGEQGAGTVIPPNSVLVFEVELLKVTKAVAAAPASDKKDSKAAPKESKKSKKK